MNGFVRLLVWTVLFLFVGPLLAEVYPTKPLRIIVPYPPGGGADVVGRTLGEYLTGRLGQQVQVENVAGGSGAIGAAAAARAAPDGYTLFLGSDQILAINPGLFSRLSYDPVNDFEPVALAANITFALVVHPELSANSVQELIMLARSQPGKLNYVSIGAGSQHHLGMELFKATAGIDLVHVPYKGSAQYLPDLLSGRVSVIFTGLPPVLRHIQSGKLRALAVGSKQRSLAMPNVPTVAESGVPGFEMSAWFGVLTPSKVSKEIIERLNTELIQISRLPELKDRLSPQGAEPLSSTPEEFRARINEDRKKWQPVIRASGARAE